MTIVVHFQTIFRVWEPFIEGGFELSEKKGFVLYFDSYDSITSLTDEQRGILLLALYQYADRICRREVKVEEIFEDYPNLTPESRMAFRFLAGNIQRDTEKWKKSKNNYQKGAQKRKEKPSYDEEMMKYIKYIKD